MDALKYIEMISDEHIFDLKKMGYKYSVEEVAELLDIMKAGAFRELSLTDFAEEENLVYVPSLLKSSAEAAKSLLGYRGNEPYGMLSLEDEIFSTFQIEQIDTSRESVRSILAGKAPKDREEHRVWGMKQGFEFIADRRNKISRDSMRMLYETAVNPYQTESYAKLRENQMYRDGEVAVLNTLQEKKIHRGIAPEKIEEKMEQLFSFIQQDSDLDDLTKAAAIHFYIGYIHPYFDGNGRMARLVHLWYLLQKGYSAALFLPFSSLIQQSKAGYNKAYEKTEANRKISGLVDITPFLFYFQDCVYRKIGMQKLESNVLEQFSELLKLGKLTGKEKELFHFVLSKYGTGEFSTKMLERDFGDCAYATVRAFVLKLTDYGVLEHHAYGNRNRYCIAFPQHAVKKQ